MKRRNFLAVAAACTAIVCSQRLGIAFAQQPRVRRNINSPGAAQDIATLREGVKKLRENQNAEKYASWMYWANSHGLPGNPPEHMKPVWKRCEHGSLHFLSWHRAYVYYFEELIRQVTQRDSFALPYWDWYASSEIPEAFIAQNNSLLHSPRNFSPRALLSDALEADSFEEFSFVMEGNPHGSVHIMVGGDMGHANTAGRDPLFWAHHCNVDRLWEVWLKNSPQNRNPVDENWLQKKFTFDLEGTKQLETRQLVDTRALGYEYESAVTQPEAGSIIPARPVRVIEVQPTSQEAGDIDSVGSRVLGRSAKIELAADSLSVKFNIGSNDRARFMAVPESSGSSPLTLTVRLADIKVTDKGAAGGFEYRLYVNLPEVTGGAPHETFYVGSLTSFQIGVHEHHGAELLVPLRGAIKRLAARQLWSSSEVLLSIVSTQNTTEPLLTIGRAELLLGER